MFSIQSPKNPSPQIPPPHAKLEDSSERMIGLYGGGVMGKTTLIKAIAKKGMDNKLFNVVAI